MFGLEFHTLGHGIFPWDVMVLCHFAKLDHITRRGVYHASEGDVVRSSALHLLHPLNQALSLLASNGEVCRSEFRAAINLGDRHRHCGIEIIPFNESWACLLGILVRAYHNTP